jgi:putative ABC transport system permease protein
MFWQRWMHALPARFRTIALSRPVDQELDDEIAFHIAMQTAANMERGMSEEEAARLARQAIAGVEQTKERCRDVRPLRWAQDLASDLRYAVRSLRRSPTFTLVAIITLALGIGASTAIFRVVSAILLRPLPYADADRLVRVWSTGQGHPRSRYESALPDYRAWRAANRSFEDIGAYYVTAHTLTGTDRVEGLQGAHMTANLWSLLRVPTLQGAVFSATAEEWGAHRVVVVSEGLWRRRLGANPHAIGNRMELDDQPYTVLGVMPASFQFPGADVDFWVPLAVEASSPNNTRRTRFVDLLGRLKPSVTLAQAQADLAGTAATIAREEPAYNAGLSVTLATWREPIVGSVRPTIWLLLGAVTFVLLIACANVANLLLARGAAREHEFTIRATLGANRHRLARQLLTECLLLSSLAAVAGTALTYAAIRVLSALGPATVPRLREVRFDGGVIGIAMGLTLLTALVFGLWPAHPARRLGLVGRLHESMRTVTASRRQAHLRQILIVGEIAVSLVLLIGAAMLMLSLRRVQQVDPGFQPDHLFTARLTLPGSKYPPGSREAFIRQVVDGVAALPGIRSVGLSTALPLARGDWTKPFWVDGRAIPAAVGQVPLVAYCQVTPDYLRTMGVSLRRGRLFTPRDTRGQPLVAIINETIARRFWPGGDPIGARIAMNPPEALVPSAFPLPSGATSFPRLTVVGVIGDFRQRGLDRDANAEVFVPFAQAGGVLPETAAGGILVARTVGDPLASISAIQAVVTQFDRNIPLTNVRAMDDRLSESLAERRFVMVLIDGFAAVSIVLSLGGLYGVISYATIQRRQELGVRAALGATAADSMRLFMADGLRLTAIGIGIGLPLAGALTQFMSAQLFQSKTVDPVIYGSASLMLVTVAAAACAVPAFRATRADPVVALRSD